MVGKYRTLAEGEMLAEEVRKYACLYHKAAMAKGKRKSSILENISQNKAFFSPRFILNFIPKQIGVKSVFFSDCTKSGYLGLLTLMLIYHNKDPNISLTWFVF